MERKITEELIKWKKNIDRKPLLLYGPPGVGKTYSVLDFGKKEYKTIAYINCNNNYELLNVAKKENSIDKIVLKLSLLVGESILKGDTLIVIDDVNDLDVVKMVKLFGKSDNEYHIIMVTNIKDNVTKFKGDELQLKYMYQVDFEEYLKAIGQVQLIDFIKDSYKNNKEIPFHQIALDNFDNYMMTGGSPEACEEFIKNSEVLNLSSIHNKLINAYRNSILTVTNMIDVQRSIEVLDIMPYQLIKSNKKFQYGLMKEGSRKKEYENSINFLSNNNLVLRSYKVSEVGVPLSKYKDVDSFKLYTYDTGVLFDTLHLSKIKFLTNDKLKSLLYENSVAISIADAGYQLYYYASDGKAEVAFLVQSRKGEIVPIEIVNTSLSKAKSLGLLMKKYDIKNAIRVGENNFSYKKGIKYIPVYATFCFKENL